MMACDLEGSKIVSTKKIESSKNAVSMRMHSTAAAITSAAERIMRRIAWTFRGCLTDRFS